MRPSLATIACLMFFVSQPATSQQGADELLVIANRVAQTLIENPAARGVQPYDMPRFTLDITSARTKTWNAFAVSKTHTIEIGYQLASLLQDDEDEFAFVIAHELGHLQDANCYQRGQAQHLTGTALQRMCEASADQIAIQYMLAAGYSAFDAAGAMGRLLMLDQSQTSIRGIIVGRFTSDHPVSIDRIRQIDIYAHQACEQRPEICVR